MWAYAPAIINTSYTITYPKCLTLTEQLINCFDHPFNSRKYITFVSYCFCFVIQSPNAEVSI